MASKTRPDISFGVLECVQFTHNTKASYHMALKRTCWYLRGTTDNGLVFNPSKKPVVGFYADADFAVLQGHKNPEDHIHDRSRTGFVVTFTNFLSFAGVKTTDIYCSFYTVF